MSQRPDRPNRVRLGRQHPLPIVYGRRRKQYSLLWLVEGERGTRLGRVDVAGASSSQAGQSQMVDQTQ